MGTLGFIVFNHGLPYYATLGSGWEKFTLGFYHSLTARTSGLAIVYLSDLAPSSV